MKTCAYFGRKLEHLCNLSCNKLHCFQKSSKTLINSFIHLLIFKTSPFLIQLFYFLFISVFGYFALKISNPKTDIESPKNIDIFFTSVSSATVSSMSTLEMEIFSNTQLIIITILMLLGGEVFISMFGLFFQLQRTHKTQHTNNSLQELASFSGDSAQKPENDVESNIMSSLGGNSESLKFAALKCLGYVVLGYLIVVHLIGSSLVAIYASLVPSLRALLHQKGIKLTTFSTFIIVSTFTNCGFVPTNENMIVFKKNSGLLLLLIPQILFGNSLYGPSLRIAIWVLEKITRREEYSYILKNNREIGYTHLMPRVRCWYIAITAFGFIALQFVVFCCIEWNSALMNGLNAYEKMVAVIFEVVNSRHAGESVFDLSAISPAILVIFVVMMYLPPYASYMPLMQEEEKDEKGGRLESKNGRKTLTPLQCLLFSQLSYLLIFIILICIVERKKLKTDPLNFNVFNITLEVISAYGNVGFSTGYSCERQIKADSNCREKWIGFVGEWSNLGKFFLILIMLFGKLKNFNRHGGQAWNLS